MALTARDLAYWWIIFVAGGFDGEGACILVDYLRDPPSPHRDQSRDATAKGLGLRANQFSDGPSPLRDKPRNATAKNLA